MRPFSSLCICGTKAMTLADFKVGEELLAKKGKKVNGVGANH